MLLSFAVLFSKRELEPFTFIPYSNFLTPQFFTFTLSPLTCIPVPESLSLMVCPWQSKVIPSLSITIQFPEEVISLVRVTVSPGFAFSII